MLTIALGQEKGDRRVFGCRILSDTVDSEDQLEAYEGRSGTR
jgi:hypothetical protein